MRTSRTQKPSLVSNLKTSGDRELAGLVQELDRMHGAAIALQDQQGRMVTVRWNTSTNRMEVFSGGRWIASAVSPSPVNAVPAVSVGVSSAPASPSGGLAGSVEPSRLVASSASKWIVSTDLFDWITGTPNQVVVADDFDGTVTLSLPQSIDVSADVTFDSLVLDDLTASRLVASDANEKLVSTDAHDWITGVANRVTVTDDLDGTVTLTAPQDIHTAASPTFAGLTVGALAGVLKGTAGVVGVAAAGTDFGIVPDVQVLTNSGNWVMPAGVKTVKVIAIGGGGGGGGASGAAADNLRNGGGGGGGGAYIERTFRALDIGPATTQVAYVVGQAGLGRAGGTAGAGTAGDPGTSTTFGPPAAPLVYAGAGGGGKGGTTNTISVGGGGGGTGSIGTTGTGIVAVAGGKPGASTATASGGTGCQGAVLGAGYAEFGGGGGGGQSASFTPPNNAGSGGSSVFGAGGGGVGGGTTASNVSTVGAAGGRTGSVVGGGGTAGGAVQGNAGGTGTAAASGSAGGGGSGGAGNNAGTGGLGGNGAPPGGGGGGGGGGTNVGGAGGNGANGTLIVIAW